MGAKPIISFVELKERFYSRFPSLSVFDCGQINLVKVVLEGLKVRYSSRGKVGHMMNRPVWLYTFKLWVQRRRKSNYGSATSNISEEIFSRYSSRPYLFVDHTQRVVQDTLGNPVSLYFHTLLSRIGKQNVVFLNENSQSLMRDVDIALGGISGIIRNSPLDEHETEFRRQLIEFYKKICSSFDSSEQLDIGVAIEKFFEDYRVWRYALKRLPQRNIVLLCHYHHEGAIWAMREAGRIVIELQHGLISEEDIFYCFPPVVGQVRDRALFPDMIFTYGEYWKNILLKGSEFTLDQIEVLGYYLYEGAQISTVNWEELKYRIGNSKVILITTQTFLHEHFIRYVKWLASDIRMRKLNYKILVKIHPSEKAELYSELTKDSGIEMVHEPLSSLFSITDLHVSIYSTTLYEAMRFGLRSFSLDVEPSLSGYVDRIVNDGIATRISGRDNPIDFVDSLSVHQNVTYYFDTLDTERLVGKMK